MGWSRVKKLEIEMKDAEEGERKSSMSRWSGNEGENSSLDEGRVGINNGHTLDWQGIWGCWN